MKKPKKEGNRHLLAAYSKEALEELAVRLKVGWYHTHVQY